MQPYDYLWERADLLSLSLARVRECVCVCVCVCVLSCDFVTVQYGVQGQAWWLIVLIHNICIRPYICISIGTQASVINCLRSNKSCGSCK